MHNRPIWMERPERGNLLAMRALAWVALRLGRRGTRLFLWPICLYYLLFSPVACKAVRTFLMRATKHRPSLRDLFRHLFVYATILLDRVYFLNGQIGLFDIRVHGERELLAVLDRGQGCFLMGSHLGSFELLRVCGFHRSGIHIATLMHEESARKMNSVLRSINPAAPYEVIASGRIDSMLKVRDCLDRGDCIGILADRALTDSAVLSLPFLDAPADFSVGPFRLAVMLGRPIVFMVGVYRGGNRYDIHLEQLSFDEQCASKAQSEQALLSYVKRLEYYCRLVPSNWFNFYEFWPSEDNS